MPDDCIVAIHINIRLHDEHHSNSFGPKTSHHFPPQMPLPGILLDRLGARGVGFGYNTRLTIGCLQKVRELDRVSPRDSGSIRVSQTQTCYVIGCLLFLPDVWF